MDLSRITGISGFNVNKAEDVSSLTGSLFEETKKADGTVFEAFLNTAIDNINTTNTYLSNAENEEIRFALGETENTHDLTIALQKASTALQYTVAVRDKLLEAYKEIMNMQI
ncbi:MAG: flagellar hook-basal body complex protein FliE [Lachnospiraceae bacterium]|nr:flagellar hook-basal body complex protein FliE [Lachnospiraceae bacterium]